MPPDCPAESGPSSSSLRGFAPAIVSLRRLGGHLREKYSGPTEHAIMLWYRAQSRRLGKSLFTRSKQLELLRHSDEFSKGASLHLVHDLSAMNFNGDFAGPKFGSNLLIEHSPNHQLHDFVLALRQRVVAALHSSNLRSLLPTGGVACQSLLNSFH